MGVAFPDMGKGRTVAGGEVVHEHVSKHGANALAAPSSRPAIGGQRMNDSSFRRAAIAAQQDRDCLWEDTVTIPRAQYEALMAAASEATIAWACCASLHREYAKGKDPFYTTRQADFVKHEETARASLRAAGIQTEGE